MTHACRLAHLTAVVAVAAAGFLTLGTAHAGEPAVRIVELPRVTVVAKRSAMDARQSVGSTAEALSRPAGPAAAAATRIVELPRVVVVAKRLQPSATVLAERASRASGV